jgi:hypothetical protein
VPIPDGERIAITCVVCRKTFDAVMPRCEIVDTETLTVLAWAHPLREVCPYCGQAHQMRVVTLQGFSLEYVGVKNKGDSAIAKSEVNKSGK